MVQLFPDQGTFAGAILAMFRRLRAQGRRQSVLGVASTGFGKTYTFSYVAYRRLTKNLTSGVLVHREELLDQVSEAFKQFEIPHAVIGSGRGGYDKRCKAFVISAPTYAKNLERMPRFGMGIVDEAHHAVAGSTWDQCLDHAGCEYVLGMSATPERLDGRSLRSTFEEMVFATPLTELWALGRLTPYKLIAPPGFDRRASREKGDRLSSRAQIVGDVVEQYTKHLAGAPTVGFFHSVKASHEAAALFRAAGYNAVSLDGKTHKDVRRNALRDFREGRLHYLANFALFDEGLDVPGIIGVQDAAPTESLVKFRQRGGRMMRKAHGKAFGYYLDHVGNWTAHGLFEEERAWSLDGREAREAKEAEEAAIENRQCPTCYAVSPPGAVRCRDCGALFPVKERVVVRVQGDLIEIDPSMRHRSTAHRSEIEELAHAASQSRRQASLEETCIRKARERADAAGKPFTAEDRARAIRQAGHIRDSYAKKRRAS